MAVSNRIYTLLWLVLLALVSGSVRAASFKEANLDDAEFLLLNIRLQQQQLITAAEAYQVDEQTLLPASQLTNALGAGITLDADQGTLLVNINNKSIAVDLRQQTSSQPLIAIDPAYHWASDGFELYLPHQLLEQLLGAKFTIHLSTLSASIASVDELFPIEKQWQRARTPVKKSEEEQKVQPLYVEDDYKLVTPPTANLNLSFAAQGGDDRDQSAASYNAQLVGDLLYHSARISLNQNTNNNDLVSRVNFSRHQPRPDQPLWGGLRQYSFGDISAGSQALLNNTPAGLGVQLSQRPTNFSRTFGTKNIEGDATPGWEVQLYRNGFLVETTTVPDNGHYFFADVETRYGNNYFEIRLFGPFGEEEVHRETVNIGSNWLPKGQFAYDAYFLDRNRTMLSSSPDGVGSFGSDMGFSFDYSPFNNTAIGSFYQRSRDSAINRDDFQQYFGTHVQSALSNLLLDLQLVKQLDYGHRLALRGSGRFPWDQSYSFRLEDNRDFSNNTVPNGNKDFNAEINTGGLLPLGRWRYDTTLAYRASENQRDVWRSTLGLSGRFFGAFLNNNLSYTRLGLPDVTDPINGNLSMTANMGQLRLSGGLNYTVQPNTELNSVTLNGAWRSEDNSYQSARLQYNPNASSDNRWDASYGYSQDFGRFRVGLNAEVGSDEEWALNLNMNFFLDYDAHNRRFLLSSRGSADSGNLNVTAYLDRNNNNRRDEADWTLEGVKFSPLPLWAELTTSETGQVSLPGVPAGTPFSFSAQWQDGVATKQGSYTVYTHPGSRIDVDIPFEIKTNIAGFAIVTGDGREFPLATGEIELTNLDNEERRTEKIDIDGFFEFINLTPGRYAVQLKDETQQQLKLISQTGRLEFVTPPRGGDYELPPLFLLRANDAPENLPASTRVVLDEELGESFYFDDLPEGRQIYSAPWDYRLPVSSGDGQQQPSSNVPLPPPTAITSDQAMITEATQNLENAPNPAVPVPGEEEDEAANPIQEAAAVASYILALRGPGAPAAAPAATQALPRPAPAQTQTDGGFHLQVGAFSQRGNAENWLRQHPGIAADCLIAAQPPLHVVRCGQFDQRQQATAYRQTLRGQYPGLRPVLKATTAIDTRVLQAVNNTSPRAILPTSVGDQYTIQLLVASQQATIDSFVQQYRLDQAQLTVTDKLVNGRSVKALTLGQFDTSSNARLALSQLPPALRSQVWITKMNR